MWQCGLVRIDCGIIAPGHGKEVVYGLNDFDKRYIHQLMSNVQLPVSNIFDSHIIMHSSIKNKDFSLAE